MLTGGDLGCFVDFREECALVCGQRALRPRQWCVLLPLASLTYGAIEGALRTALARAKMTAKSAAPLRPARPQRDGEGAGLYALPKNIDGVLVTLVGVDGARGGAGGQSAQGRSSATWAS